MKKSIILSIMSLLILGNSFAQKAKKLEVPVAVKTALANKYPASSSAKITWETEKGHYEANCGGKSGEDNSVQFTPAGEFIEIVKAMPSSQLPKPVLAYINEHYKGAKISEAATVTDAKDKLTYEVEINRKEIIFDEKGNFIKG